MNKSMKIIVPIIVAVIAAFVAIVAITLPASVNEQDIVSMIETGQKYLSELNFSQAIAEFCKVIEIDPKNVDAYLGLANAYIGNDENDKAIEILEIGLAETGDIRLQNLLDSILNTDLNSNEDVTIETEISETTKNEVVTYSEDDLLEYLKNKTGYDIVDYMYADMDHDGKNEIVAALDEKENDTYIENEMNSIWFCSCDESEVKEIYRLGSDIKAVMYEFYKMTYDNYTHICFNYSTGAAETLYNKYSLVFALNEGRIDTVYNGDIISESDGDYYVFSYNPYAGDYGSYSKIMYDEIARVYVEDTDEVIANESDSDININDENWGKDIEDMRLVFEIAMIGARNSLGNSKSGSYENRSSIDIWNILYEFAWFVYYDGYELNFKGEAVEDGSIEFHQNYRKKLVVESVSLEKWLHTIKYDVKELPDFDEKYWKEVNGLEAIQKEGNDFVFYIWGDAQEREAEIESIQKNSDGTYTAICSWISPYSDYESIGKVEITLVKNEFYQEGDEGYPYGIIDIVMI